MGNFTIIMILILFAYITMKLAQKKGYEPTLWVILGFLFGIFTVVVIVLLPTKVDKSKRGRN